MTEQVSRGLVVAAMLVATSPAFAERLDVKVTEVAGGIAYLDHGRAAGVVRGTKVQFGKTTYVVVETTEKTASIDLGGNDLAAGASGVADVTPGATTEVKRLPPPRPAEVFAGAWPAVVVPAAEQQPRMVPLGSGRPPGRAHVAVIGHGYVAVDRDHAMAQGEARVTASYDLMTDRPLAADLDAVARLFTAGANSGARVPFMVRTAQVRYGDAYDPQFALGRLRYAASSVGMLDGARASVQVRGVTVAAFGGLVPDPVNAKPDTGAARFGAEVSYEHETSPWRPRVDVTAYGSTWDGEVDERRVAVTASARRAALFVDGWAEVQAFAADNPWGASAVELTGGGATARWRRHGYHLGADLTFLRPERSLRLAAALPPEWLCTQAPQPGDVPSEACTGGDSWTSGSVFAGASGANWAVDAIGAVGRTNGIETAYDSSGYLSGELRFGPQRLLAGVSAGSASFARWTAGHIGAGYAMSRTLDLAVRYRPELLDYRAATEAYLQHAITVDVHAALAPNLDLVVSAVGTSGPDRDAAALLTTLAWRPYP